MALIAFEFTTTKFHEHEIPLYTFFSLPRRSLCWKHEKANIKKIAKEQQQDRNILMQRKM